MTLYLLKRGSTYYFRRAIPPDLRPAIGRTEFVFSLKTKDPGEAKRRRTSAISATDMLLANAHSKILSPASTCVPLSPDSQRAEFELPKMTLASSSSLPVRRSDFSSWHELLNLWQEDRNAVKKTQQTYLRIAHQFHDFSRKNVSDTTKKDVVDFKNDLIRTKRKTNANVQEILSKLRSLLGIAVDNDILEFNPASDVKVTVKKGENKRLPFSHEDLAKIFSSPIFTSGVRPTQGKGEAAFFIPILMLLHGIRPRELAQVRTKDVRSHTIFDHEGNKSSWPFFHLTKDIKDGLSLKNEESERFVPVHPAAIQLGFIDYIQDLRDANIYWVFPRLKADKFGNRAAKWSEWFNHCLRTEHGISDRRKVLYSFRHTFKDLARACGMPDELQRAIMGHAGLGVADTYGSGFGLHRLLEAIRMMRVPGVSIKGVPL